MKYAAFAAILALTLSACGSAPPPPPKPAPKACEPVRPTLAITATARVNAEATGEGRPVQVRIYQLRSDARLRTASFEDVWQNDSATFDKDLIGVEEQTLFPGETKLVPLTPQPGAGTLALVALFREPQGKDWFVTYELEQPRAVAPCPKEGARIPVWVDRMQIQDGAGREAEPSETTPTSDAAAPPPSTGSSGGY
jgi:type VI secretion system protein VasD